ncbi:hypothetical protein, partial [Mycobacteroides abscessus]
QTKWLTEYQKLAAEIAEHNAHPFVGSPLDPAFSAYNAEAARQNADMAALLADAGRMQLPDVPIAQLLPNA